MRVFPEFVRFELDYQFRRPATWIYLALLFGSTLLLAVSSDPVGGTHFNAPVKLASYTIFVGLFGTLVTAGLFVEAGYRDHRFRTIALFNSAPVRDGEYLCGRFLGCFLVNALLLLAIPVGLLVASRIPEIAAGTIGPYRPSGYVLPYLVILLPNLFVSAALMFGITSLTRRSLPGYLGAVALLAAYLVALNASVGVESSQLLALLLDPTGAAALTALTEGWTRAEQNARLIGLDGALLWNRLLWTAAGVSLLAFTYHRFRFSRPVGDSDRGTDLMSGGQLDPARDSTSIYQPGVIPAVSRLFHLRTRIRQAVTTVQISIRHTVLQPEFLVVGLGVFLLGFFGSRETLNGSLLGTPVWPLTPVVVQGLTSRSVELVIALITAFYAGEVIWRDRDSGVQGLVDTTPTPTWCFLIGNFLALVAVLVLLQAALMSSGIVVQTLGGYRAFEPALYLQALFGLQLSDYLLFAVLALAVHVSVNHKYMGHLVVVALFVGISRAQWFGIDHQLLVYGSDPGWRYSEFNGFGSFIGPFIWFKLYWASWALLLGLGAVTVWVRGAESPLIERLRAARRSVTPRWSTGLAVAGLLVTGTGGYIFYNTNILNPHSTEYEENELRAEYERRYSRFEYAAQPQLTGVRLKAELYPSRRRAVLRATYRLVNESPFAIDSVHLTSFPFPDLTLDEVRFDRGAELTLDDREHGYRIYELSRALHPGDTSRLDVRVTVQLRGFKNEGVGGLNTSLVENGTYLQMRRLLPSVGYQRKLMELSDADTRRQHGLEPRPYYPPIYDPPGRQTPSNAPDGDWIEFAGTVGTADDQTAVLPGTLQRSWVENGRRYFHYRAESAVLNSIGLWSARYAVHESRWNGVTIQILHHPDHTFNLTSTVENVRASLDVFTRRFGPYPYGHFRLVEIPNYQGSFGRAYPGQMVYTESSPIALARIREDATDEVDTPLLLTAHELSHQWWGHQVAAADVQGSPMLSETLAQFSAVKVMEQQRGMSAVRRFLYSMQIAYLEGRGSHDRPEVPLLLSGDHPYIHYRKGPVVMYALQNYLGEKSVDSALRKMLDRHRFEGPPYPTSLDLYQGMRAGTPDSLRQLLADLVATITLWDLEVVSALAEPIDSSKYLITLDLAATKIRSDSLGNETEVSVDHPVAIGVFAQKQEGLDEPLYLNNHRLTSGRQTIRLEVSGLPARVVVDPYHLLPARSQDVLIDLKSAEIEIRDPRAEESGRGTDASAGGLLQISS